MKSNRVLAIYDDYEAFVRSLKELKQMASVDLFTYTPVPCHEVDEILDQKESPLRHFTLAGGLVGFAAGGAMTVYCSLAWVLIVGGKPIISIPPYLIIAFELTILFATLFSAFGYFILSPFPRGRPKGVYDPSFSEDKFGVLAAGPEIDAERIKAVMERNGARETRLL